MCENFLHIKCTFNYKPVHVTDRILQTKGIHLLKKTTPCTFAIRQCNILFELLESSRVKHFVTL